MATLTDASTLAHLLALAALLAESSGELVRTLGGEPAPTPPHEDAAVLAALERLDMHRASALPAVTVH